MDDDEAVEPRPRRELRPKFDEEALGSNPLTHSLQIPIRQWVKSGVFKHDRESGVNLNEEAELEATPYAKVFVTPERRKLYAAMSVRAKELWGWLQYELDVGKDYIWIPKWRFMDEVGMGSLNTYKAAVKELVRYHFLCPTMFRDVFWVNPDFAFNGSRLKKYPNNLVSVEKVKVKDA